MTATLTVISWQKFVSAMRSCCCHHMSEREGPCFDECYVKSIREKKDTHTHLHLWLICLTSSEKRKGRSHEEFEREKTCHLEYLYVDVDVCLHVCVWPSKVISWHLLTQYNNRLSFTEYLPSPVLLRTNDTSHTSDQRRRRPRRRRTAHQSIEATKSNCTDRCHFIGLQQTVHFRLRFSSIEISSRRNVTNDLSRRRLPLSLSLSLLSWCPTLRGTSPFCLSPSLHLFN